MNDMYKPREQVIIFDQGINIPGIMNIFLKNKSVITVNSLDEALEAQKQHQCDFLFCSLLLSHSQDTEDCKNTMARLHQGFRNIAFFEPSLYGSEFLAEFGLKNFHSGFDTNRFLPFLTVDFLLNHTAAYAVTHLGANNAFDSSAIWIVPTGYPRNAFPGPNIKKTETGIVDFKRPIPEYSCFLYSAFDARSMDLEDDLFFLEKKTRVSAFHLARDENLKWILMNDAGALFYQTADNLSAGRHVRDPAQLVVRCRIAQAGPTEHPAETTWLDTRPASALKMQVCRLDDCVVTGTGAILSKRRMIAESAYLMSLPEDMREGMRRPHAVGRVEGLAILAINKSCRNYYHWLVQMLPLVQIASRTLREAGEQTITVVTGKTFRFHHEYLKLLLADFSEVNVISLKPHEYVTVGQGLYSNLAGRDGPSHWIAEHLELAQTLRERAGVRQESASRHIYICRSDGSGRFIKNEDELIAQMRARGFEILTLSEMPLRDQILAFSNARIVIGPHGAGLSNILYSSDQTILIELLQSTYANNCMLRLAQNVGARHIAQFFFPDHRSAPFPGEWYVDVDRVCALLDRVLDENAGQAAA